MPVPAFWAVPVTASMAPLVVPLTRSPTVGASCPARRCRPRRANAVPPTARRGPMASESMGEQYREAERQGASGTTDCSPHGHTVASHPTGSRQPTVVHSPRGRSAFSRSGGAAARPLLARSAVPPHRRRRGGRTTPPHGCRGSAGSPRCSSGWRGSAPGRPARSGHRSCRSSPSDTTPPGGIGSGAPFGSVPPMLEPLRAAATTTFDLEADVVVVGLGCAGACGRHRGRRGRGRRARAGSRRRSAVAPPPCRAA